MPWIFRTHTQNQSIALNELKNNNINSSTKCKLLSLHQRGANWISNNFRLQREEETLFFSLPPIK